ncbi:MAG TPA: alkaline phosphatase family protein [Fimbriimonas sp.]|nr:alkaline phosphatase family protein [Fimbriimonas sp.]
MWAKLLVHSAGFPYVAQRLATKSNKYLSDYIEAARATSFLHMPMNKRLSYALGAVCACSLTSAQSIRPRLVVVISIDQFRADYLERFAPHYLPARSAGTVGGFNYLKHQGANFTDAHYDQVPTATGPGHATILTGSIPALHGIVGNDWYDRKTGKGVYCVEDASSTTVGGPSKPMSPRNLLVTTVGDELKMATNGKAKVVSVAFKDRASILLAGHAPDAAIWFDTLNGDWVTSSFYANSLPAWVKQINDLNVPDAGLNQTWKPLLPGGAYALTRRAPFESQTPSNPVFAHSLNGDNPKSKYGNWTTSPQGQQYVFDTVKAAIKAESLGKDEISDLLTINLSTNDYVGHAYGPNSPEVMDISVATDRMLSDLFTALEKSIGLSNILIAVTADHGVVPIPEEAQKIYRLPALRLDRALVIDSINESLEASYGKGQWVLSFGAPHLYLNRALASSVKADFSEVARTAADAAMSVPGIASAFTSEQIREGRLPSWPWAKLVANGFFQGRAGDVYVLESPGTYFGGGTGTGHGSAWAYDTHVPILLSGFGVKAGVYSERVSVTDLAPTLTKLLGIEQPNGNVGRVLTPAMK